MTDTKQHLIHMIVYHSIESMDMKDLIEFAQEMLYREYESWAESDLKNYLNQNWPLDE